jgi:transcriptional regulator with XRE-family HTH domain
VARRLGTTKSAVSRFERGLLHRPTLTTIENYALVVRRRVQIRILPWP